MIGMFMHSALVSGFEWLASCTPSPLGSCLRSPHSANWALCTVFTGPERLLIPYLNVVINDTEDKMFHSVTFKCT